MWLVLQVKTGEDYGKFMGMAQGLAESILPSGYGEEKGGEFLRKVIQGEKGGITHLLDSMKSKLSSYEEQKGDALQTLRREGGERAGKTYKSIGEAKATPYKTGRTGGIIEELLTKLSAEE